MSIARMDYFYTFRSISSIIFQRFLKKERYKLLTQFLAL